MKSLLKLGWDTLRKPSVHFSLGFLVIGGFYRWYHLLGWL